ncbi:hypothetical protein [Catenulispora pinisilvae]|uniref:hypothetical protein n=2 Tax=Catenulispora pinisilvae TaxID=2705253 RepID=UPI0018927047|nr:hypothetical protein [Catenulispora pinisilvae]
MSALYPAPSPSATTWLATLRTTLARLADQVRPGPPIDAESLATQLESESPEAAELGGELRAMLRGFGPVISGLTAAFGLAPTTMLIALGRGAQIGEVDPVVAAAVDEVDELRALTSSGTVTIAKDGRSTTLIAATTVAGPTGPLRIAWPDREDVWLCAVQAAASPALTARAALERILPQVGVSRAHIRAETRTRTAHTTQPRPPTAHLHAALLAVDPTADPDLVMARLEGWRAALEQLHQGAVAIHWEQA